jgi:hypothetical protein
MHINECHANILQFLKEKSSEKVEKMKKEEKKRSLLLANHSSPLPDSYLKSKSFQYRKMIFIIGLISLWILVWIYGIFSKKNKKNRY